jgi:hypothetical protein
VCSLSDWDFEFCVKTGGGILCVPPDIFNALKYVGLIKQHGAGFAITLPTDDMGDTILRVVVDPELKNGLILKISDVEKRTGTKTERTV